MCSPRPLHALGALFLFGLFVGAGQRGGAQDDQTPQNRDLWPWNKSTQKDNKQLLADMQGAWQLTAFEDPKVPAEDRQEVGYALVVDEFMSIELHMGWTPDRQPPFVMLHTGTYQIFLGPGHTMELTTLIGTFTNRLRSRAERPGVKREYDVRVSQRELTLSRSDGYTITFQRLGLSKMRRDIYGREIRPKTPEDG